MRQCISGPTTKKWIGLCIGLMALSLCVGHSLAQSTDEELKDTTGLFSQDSKSQDSEKKETQQPELSFLVDGVPVVTVTRSRDAVVCTRESCACISLGEDGQPDVTAIQRHEAFQFVQKSRTRCR